MACRLSDLQDLAYGFLDPGAEARVRSHLAGCGRCKDDVARLEGEKKLLAGAAAAFAAALVLGLVWLMKPSGPAPADPVVAAAAQDKGKSAREIPDTEEALRAEIARLDAALAKTSDEQEKYRIKTT